MDSTGLEGEGVTYEVVLRFRRGGPALFGAWPEFETADRKFTQWLGTWGQADAVLTLTAVAGSVVYPVKHWTAEGGVQAGSAGSV
ncbi:hypothetical protein ACIGHB_33025 [Streptomyces sp. NPDC085460]|uniref:hypothetical protein n=1 Tax=Streptomyces sp. NPDC085460 TaxID=3365723 RepID=UPI0037D188BC